MGTDDKIRDEYDMNSKNIKEAAKIFVLPAGKIDQHKYLTGEETLPPNQSRMIKRTKFIDFSLEKALEKYIKAIEDQGENIN